MYGYRQEIIMINYDLGKIAAILQTAFSKWLSPEKMRLFWFKFNCTLYLMDFAPWIALTWFSSSECCLKSFVWTNEKIPYLCNAFFHWLRCLTCCEQGLGQWKKTSNTDHVIKVSANETRLFSRKSLYHWTIHCLYYPIQYAGKTDRSSPSPCLTVPVTCSSATNSRLN